MLAFPFAVGAQNAANPSELVKQMQVLLDQYSEKIRILEAENKLFREIMARNNVQIPLEDYNRVHGTGAQSAIVSPSQNTPNAVNAGQNDLQR